MPDLTPAEAMERLRAVKGCGAETPTLKHKQAGAFAFGFFGEPPCPDCALLLYQAIAGPVEEEMLDLNDVASDRECAQVEEETIQRCAALVTAVDDTPRPILEIAALRVLSLARRYSGGPR